MSRKKNIGVAFCFLWQSLVASVVEDTAKLERVNSPDEGAKVLTEIITHQVENADNKWLIKSGKHRKAFLTAIHLCKPEQVQSTLWKSYGDFVKAYSILNGREVNLDRQFLHFDFRNGVVDSALNANFLRALQLVKSTVFFPEDCDFNYSALYHRKQNTTEEVPNKNRTYLRFENPQIEALKPILLSLKEPITECLGTPWRVVNIRAWESLPDSQETESNSWCTDGTPSSLFKIMFYPLGSEDQKGAWVMFKNSESDARGNLPKINEQMVVEISVVPSLDYDLTPVFAGLNASHPALPWQKPHLSNQTLYHKGELVGVNIGGAADWTTAGWVNLYEKGNLTNPSLFPLHPNSQFPLESQSVQYVYTSHVLQHLNLFTVQQLLSEAHRVLEVGGSLVIKIPDYDRALAGWRNQDGTFFSCQPIIDNAASTWATKGINDCLDYRAATLFCSFQEERPNGYFGPPVVNIPFLRELIGNRSPSEISAELRKMVSQNESPFHFIHQSAWGREELKVVLDQLGFEIVSMDAGYITDVFQNIPGIYENNEESAYCWAKKKGGG